MRNGTNGPLKLQIENTKTLKFEQKKKRIQNS